MSASPQAADRPRIDKDALRRKYREERDKRLRPEGNEQYVQIAGAHAHYLEDPYTPFKERAPVTDHVTFAFIGGGFSGLVTGARLKEAGVTDVRIIEKGGDFGGTWYWNRYPGAQCDTASMIYLPLLEEVGHRPTEKYAHAPEILAHSQNIARKYLKEPINVDAAGGGTRAATTIRHVALKVRARWATGSSDRLLAPNQSKPAANN